MYSIQFFFLASPASENIFKTIMRVLFPATYIMGLVILACSSDSRLPTGQLTVNGHPIRVEIAKTPEHRTQGLSDRPSLPPDRGMLFVFPAPSRLTFWMLRCHFDIDVAYIDNQGVIREIITMLAQPLDTPETHLIRYPSGSDRIQYALEMNGGWFGKNQVTAGTRLELEKFAAVY